MKFAVQKITTIIRITYVQKNSQIQTLILEKLLAKYRFFKKLPQIPNFTYLQKSNFQHNCIFLDQLPLPDFMTVAREEYSFSILPIVSLESSACNLK